MEKTFMSLDNNDLRKYREANYDYTGVRNLQNEQELVEYRSKSLHRIWLNDLNEGFDAHWHSSMEIVVPIEGTYEVTAGNVLYNVEPDEILFIPPRELHEIHAPSHGMRFIYILNISSITSLRSFAGIKPIMSSPTIMSPQTHPEVYDDVYNILVQIRSEYFSDSEFAELRILSLLLEMFIKIGEHRTHQNELFTNVRPSKQHDYVQRFNSALEYIDKNYTEDLSLDYLADQIGFSKYHFSRLFKQYTGYNFSDYLCFRRITAAEELLSDPNLSITEVAMGSGFASISTFNRIFKLKKGFTPSEYRKKHSGNIMSQP